MLGFLFGFLCLIGLYKVARGGWRGHGHGRWGRGRHRHRGGGGWFLHRLFERLDTTPGQEKVIKNEIDGLREELHGLKREARRSGDDVARAMKAPSLDETILGELFARHDDALRDVRKAVVGALARIHEALDERQRETLAALLESGSGGFRGFGAGPYRNWV